MKPGALLRNLLAYLAQEFSFVSTRKYLVTLAALLAVAAIAGAVVLTPSHRTSHRTSHRMSHQISQQTQPNLKEDLRRRITQRAEVDLYDDFSQGLDSWKTAASRAGAWSYDKSGFVSVGALSLLAPSLPSGPPNPSLTDYDLDASVEIETQGLGFAFRADSAQDYQAAKLLSSGTGPLRSLAVEHYAVIAGRATRPVRKTYPQRFQADTLYRVHLEVRDDTFALYIQGNLVDYWTDHRLPVGGVGLFCSPGEHARVAWIRVSHNTDTVGRMCSLLASIF
jgi:hypothetical protein